MHSDKTTEININIDLGVKTNCDTTFLRNRRRVCELVGKNG